ncbi:hypothetical protein [Neorhizobium petrolearium]|uniref:hypothetical protein n=1 Tax=Neorhizobium petrolearium TaxID=515361 RepID=UPI003F157A18
MLDQRVIHSLPLSKFNLEGLDPTLRSFVDWNGRHGPVFDHPLYRDTAMTLTAAMPADWPEGSNSPAGLARINEVVAHKKALADGFRRARKWEAYVFTHHRPYRVDALLEAVREVGASRLWPLVGHVWRDSESNMQSEDEWAEIWSHAYDRHGRFRKCHKRVMSAKDQRTFEAFPEILTVYRGCFSEDDVIAYSWTLDREKAEWFARRKRWNGSPVVAKVEVHKSAALAYFSDRNESEVVLDCSAGLCDCDFEITEFEPEMQEAA